MNVTKSELIKSVHHPKRRVVNTVLKLTDAAQRACSVTLTLGEANAMLTHIRNLTRLARWNILPPGRPSSPPPSEGG